MIHINKPLHWLHMLYYIILLRRHDHNTLTLKKMRLMFLPCEIGLFSSILAVLITHVIQIWINPLVNRRFIEENRLPSGRPTRRRTVADFTPLPPISSLSDGLCLRFQPDNKSLQLIDRPTTHVNLHIFYHLITIPCHLYQ
jgi:hypothetical protein